VVSVPSNGTSGGYNNFQVRACNVQGLCAEGSPFSANTPIYDRVSAPSVTVAQSGTEATWTIAAQEQANPPYALYAPITAFRLNLDGQDVATVSPTTRDFRGAVATYHSTHPEGGSHTLTAVAVAGAVDGEPVSEAGAATAFFGASTFAPQFSAVNLTGGTVRVTWSGDDLFPTKLARNGTDAAGTGPWDTDQLSPPGVPVASAISKTFDFTGLVPNSTYIFTLTYRAGRTHPAGSLTTQLRT
jgi:hypothetical protein